MKKFHLLGVVLVAVFAFAALTAASASAVTFLLAEWLVGGLPITADLNVEATGELELEETILGLKIVAVCSGILDGTIGPNGLDVISELLTLDGLTVISLVPLVEPGLGCTNGSNCPEPLVWAVHLPWESLLELMEEGTEVFFADLIFSSGAGNPGWYVACMGSGTSDECTVAEGVSEKTNEGSNVDTLFSEAFTELAGLKLANCVTGGNEVGLVTGLGTISLVGGGTLAVSE
jgi:hypothetical protein